MPRCSSDIGDDLVYTPYSGLKLTEAYDEGVRMTTLKPTITPISTQIKQTLLYIDRVIKRKDGAGDDGNAWK